MATTQILLLNDVDSLGRQGDIVKVKAGFARNYLYPQGHAVFADPNAVRMQERLQEERRKQAAQDRKDSEAIAQSLGGTVFTFEMKVDPEGHMYGSVTAADVTNRIVSDTGFDLDKRSVALKQPIKSLGIHEVTVKLKEEVTCEVMVKVLAEGAVELPEDAAEAEAEATEETTAE